MFTPAIDLVVAEWFVDRFLEDDLATRRACLGGGSFEEALTVWHAFIEWFRGTSPPDPEFAVPDPEFPWTEGWVEQQAALLARQRRRVLFELHRVETDDGELLDVWLSATTDPQDAVHRSLVFADFDGELRVVGGRLACTACRAVPRPGIACPACGGSGWIGAYGRTPSATSTVLERRQLNGAEGEATRER
jgi:hypothetical protein